ncbi:hypothetical protein COOONC_11055, partial [Cooperia oncophora]
KTNIELRCVSREPDSSQSRQFSRSTNSFESRLLETVHTNTFSPSVFAITESPASPEEFKWSIEELSVLKPAHITQEEIAQSAYSPDPEHEAKIQSILDEYWKNNTCYIPSPDIPVKTEITIAPSTDFDFARILGPSCIYMSSEDCGEDSVFNATTSSAGSLRRRLFSEEDGVDPSCCSPTDLGDGDHSINSSIQSIRCDLDGGNQSFDGFSEIDLSPINKDSGSP